MPTIASKVYIERQKPKVLTNMLNKNNAGK